MAATTLLQVSKVFLDLTHAFADPNEADAAGIRPDATGGIVIELACMKLIDTSKTNEDLIRGE